ncbi:hypothetical protein ZOSMA_20G00060 [Zostera marina]|uniref:Transmembrane protein n=1 Tax=Zostera marina TaxID=29655 RepID=A0A0K9PMS5_ZOSMR|nr:hypothetical protein ZOSMA_20G00060 [Zostera marina]
MVIGVGEFHLPRLSAASFFFFFLLLFFNFADADGLEVASHPVKIRLPEGQIVENFLGAKSGIVMTHNRVFIRGVSRIRNLEKYANSLKVRAGFVLEDQKSIVRVPPFEVCFHKNASILLGMCSSTGSWVKIVKGDWVRSMSPYDNSILDIRMPQSASSKEFEVSTEEELMVHRMGFLITGMILMLLAHGLSDSVVFYYGGAMSVGVILVILIILFQGMKLLPTGRKSSFAIFMYSSIVGVATYILHYLSGILRSILLEIGISEDMHNPLMIFFAMGLIFAGAWLGFWTVRKFVLDEDGSIDSGIAIFVEWAIRIFAAALILESSMDTLLATEALVIGMAISGISRKSKKLRLLHRLYRNLMMGWESFEFPNNPFTTTSCNSYLKGRRHSTSSVKRTSNRPFLQDTYLSTFHNTPDRRKLSKEEWKSFTKETTKQAMEELVSSPGFGSWVAANADRITVSPSKPSI